MRTTITISDKLFNKVKKLSGKTKLTEVIVSSLEDYVSLKARLGFLEMLHEEPVPHNFSKIKAARKMTKW